MNTSDFWNLIVSAQVASALSIIAAVLVFIAYKLSTKDSRKSLKR